MSEQSDKDKFMAGFTFRYYGDDWHLGEIDGDMCWLRDEQDSIKAHVLDVNEAGFTCSITILKYSHTEEVLFRDVTWLEKEVQYG